MANGWQAVGQLGIGTWQLGGPSYLGDKPTGWGEIDEETAVGTLHKALELGVRFVDTADSYGAGQAETWVGKALKSKSLGGVEVCTKFGNRRDAAGRLFRIIAQRT